MLFRHRGVDNGGRQSVNTVASVGAVAVFGGHHQDARSAPSRPSSRRRPRRGRSCPPPPNAILHAHSYLSSVHLLELPRPLRPTDCSNLRPRSIRTRPSELIVRTGFSLRAVKPTSDMLSCRCFQVVDRLVAIDCSAQRRFRCVRCP